jgi:ABC-type sulfate transport system substrate-binding protein
MSAISKDGYEQIQVIKSALDSMYDKLNQTVYTNNNGKYEETSVFDSVKDEFEAIAGIVALTGEWTEV